MKKNILLMALAALFTIACDKTEDKPQSNGDDGLSDTSSNEVIVIRDFETDSGATADFVFFSFDMGAQIVREDSNTNKWNIGLRSTDIIVNSGTSGPGETQGQIIDALFDELETAPSEGYKSDSETELAIPKGTDAWYAYNRDTHVITPKPGKVLLFKDGEDVYKVEIISYYKGAPSNPDAFKDEARNYTFRFKKM